MAEENFLEGYFRFNQGTEIPDMFAMWCGIAGISAALGRSSFLRMGPFHVYPNQFIVLVASSGKCRKSSAINQIEDVLRMLSPMPNLIAQKLSPEALIQSMRQIETKDMTKLLAEENTGFVIADELSTFLNKKTYEAGLASLLISLYDCKDNFKYRTIARGTEEVNKACLGMLAGSTIDWIRSGVPEEAVGGGLTSRIIFVYVDKPAPPVPFPLFTPEHLALKDRLVRQLQKIAAIQGEFLMTERALKIFKDEYMEFREKTGTEFYNEKTLEGYASRRANHLLKVAMAFCAADNTDRIVKDNHLLGAKDLLVQNEKHLKLVLSLITSSDRGSDVNAVKTVIARHGRISRSDLMRIMSHKMQSRELNEIIDTLILSGDIETVGTSDGSVVYVLKDRPK